MESTSSFGYWIRRQRKALDLTQQALAERVGCSLAAIKKIEGDERRPSRQIAERLADILGVQANQREIFLEVARGLQPVDQLLLAHEPAIPAPPSGTVTFLYTDIEGSTRLWERHSQAMAIAHARHDQILRAAIESNNGYVFQVIGDEFCAAFHTVGDAVRAAVNSQVDLQAENWRETPIRVRIGIHTGKAEVQKGGLYYGYITLSHVQRVMSVGHGGQVLISFTTQALVQDELPEGVELRDLGQRQLKDLTRPEHIFQLVIPNLPADFPPLKIPQSFPHNLPAQLTSFVGREHELAEVKQLLSNTRLLTLTGPGGTGKTRLSLQLAAEVLDTKQFPDGVWLVELAPLADPTLVTQTVASTLGVREQPGRTLLDALTDYVRAKTMLLILDNCEHLIETSAQFTHSLLRAAPRLKILATSRESLGIGGETAYRVPSLPLPDPQQLHSLDALSQNDCVRLFVDRALAAYPPFRLKEKNALAIADICRRLDGIPLAIELASARTKVFPPEEIAERLDDRFRLLMGGSRTALERHQTLFALIEWSHNLLSEPERMLLRRLSIFAGGWSFEAAQAICGEGIDAEMLDLLTHLVDKSLVAAEEQAEEARYRLPETIRQHARDKLLESGESEQIRNRHLDFFLRFAEVAEPKLRSAEQLEWLNRVETEHDNLRTALAWSLESGKSKAALELAGALYYFWELHGYLSEGFKWLRDALTLSEGEQHGGVTAEELYTLNRETIARRAKALYAAGRLFGDKEFDVEGARTMIEESLRLWRQLGDKWWIAATLESSGVIKIFQGDLQTAHDQFEEGVLLAREVEDRWPLALCLMRLAAVVARTDMAAAHPLVEEAVVVARNVGDKYLLGFMLLGLATQNLIEGNLAEAEAIAKEALLELRATGGGIYVLLALYGLVVITCLQGDSAKAKGYCWQLATLSRETGNPLVTLFAGTAFGFMLSISGQPERAVRLLAAFESQARQHGMKLNMMGGPMQMAHNRFLEIARGQLDFVAFEAAWAEGQQMTIEEVIALATENENSHSPPNGLSPISN